MTQDEENYIMLSISYTAKFLHNPKPDGFGPAPRLWRDHFHLPKEETMSKKQEEEFRQLTAQALRLALSISTKKGARSIPPPPVEQAMHHTICGFPLYGPGFERNLQILARTYVRSATLKTVWPRRARPRCAARHVR